MKGELSVYAMLQLLMSFRVSVTNAFCTIQRTSMAFGHRAAIKSYSVAANGHVTGSCESIGVEHAPYNISSVVDLNRPFFPIYYNDVYEVPLPPNHRFPMKKYRQVRKIVQEQIASIPEGERERIQYEFCVSPLVTKEDLITTHSLEYVDRYLLGDLTPEEIRNVGFPWSLEGVNRSLSSTGGTVAAAISVCQARRRQLSEQNENNMKPLWSAHIAGGTHHAFEDRGEGFCVFSDIAVAANVALKLFPDTVRRILIIDLDVHQGNGNAVLFRDKNDVFTFSLHCSANYFSKKETSDLDIELPPDCNDETYLSTCNHWLNRISRDAGKFDLIFFQAGVDILSDDRLGRMLISQQGLERRNRMVFDFAHKMGVPLCITMGGGYPRKDWAPILNAHANVYLQAFDYLLKT